MKPILLTTILVLAFMGFLDAQLIKASSPGNQSESIMAIDAAAIDYGFASVPVLETDYAKKARNQKTIAWVLAGAGVGLFTAGVIVAGKDKNDIDDVVNDVVGGSALIAVGGLCALGSIPMFIVAGNNKKKAATAVIMLQPSQAVAFGLPRAFPAAGVRVNF